MDPLYGTWEDPIVLLRHSQFFHCKEIWTSWQSLRLDGIGFLQESFLL